MLLGFDLELLAEITYFLGKLPSSALLRFLLLSAVFTAVLPTSTTIALNFTLQEIANLHFPIFLKLTTKTPASS